ncbi:MAG: type II toxin-antitoxin system RelE/ParE family toxin [Candidatus Marsarchaeota archaeon]|nr:type II toxin-antitoxin system RelE/ParE family toxin [Candidatus Marsarchaeota archaeon]
MVYDILITEDAKKSFSKLAKPVQQRIYNKLKEMSTSKDPFAYAKRLKGVELFSLRVGGYRVILDIKRMELIILVIRVGPRKNVYDKI